MPDARANSPLLIPFAFRKLLTVSPKPVLSLPILIIMYLLTCVFIIDLHLYFEKVTGCVRFFENRYIQSFQLFLPFFAHMIHLLSTLFS